MIMEYNNISQIGTQERSKKEVAIKFSIFIFLIYFFTFTGSSLFNQLFIGATVRIIVFFVFYAAIGAMLGTIPWLYGYFESKRDSEATKENAIKTGKLIRHISIGVAAAGVICFLVVLLPYIAQFPQIAKRIISQIFTYAAFAFIVVFFCRIEKRQLSNLGFERKNIILQILIGIGLGALTCFVFTLLPILCKIVPAENWVIKPNGGFEIMFTILSNLLLVGTVEEFVFRGYIQTSINESARCKFTGVLIAAAAFGLWHIFNGNIINVGMAFLIGLIFGLSRACLKNCSLISVMLAHALNNILIMVAAFILL